MAHIHFEKSQNRQKMFHDSFTINTLRCQGGICPLKRLFSSKRCPLNRPLPVMCIQLMLDKRLKQCKQWLLPMWTFSVLCVRVCMPTAKHESQPSICFKEVKFC